MKKFTANKALSDFKTWIPEEDRETVLHRLTAAVGGDTGKDAYIRETVWSSLQDCTAAGSIHWKGRDHSFTVQVKSGDIAGLLSWNASTEYTLAPFDTIVKDAITKQRADDLLSKWDELIARGDVAGLLRRFDHARFTGPGSSAEMGWRDRVASLGFAIVLPQEADRIRRTLEIHAVPFVSVRKDLIDG